MVYIFKQKLRLEDLVDLNVQPKRILIHETEEYLAALYSRYFQIHGFNVRQTLDLNRVRMLAEEFTPNLLIFSLEGPGNSVAKYSWLADFSRQYPEVVLITTSLNSDAEALKKMMGVMISGHINRTLTRPQDLVEIVKTFLL